MNYEKKNQIKFKSRKWIYKYVIEQIESQIKIYRI